jgi:hypothetical protein
MALVWIFREIAEMLEEVINGVRSTEVDHICIVADLLQKMMSELRYMQANNERLALAMVRAAGIAAHKAPNLNGRSR